MACIAGRFSSPTSESSLSWSEPPPEARSLLREDRPPSESCPESSEEEESLSPSSPPDGEASCDGIAESRFDDADEELTAFLGTFRWSSLRGNGTRVRGGSPATCFRRRHRRGRSGYERRVCGT
ncbi:hypothetical protein PR003_g25722 [Phytophthora rubi]|uniref:Uncharacterized protein n=1 Tax=Phytophthora rubi TaxID=129364 RepID=A0A6A4CI82_9STRA|nr:hypothetical protein PR003_g25722 [Phytophthora rubi]